MMQRSELRLRLGARMLSVSLKADGDGLTKRVRPPRHVKPDAREKLIAHFRKLPMSDDYRCVLVPKEVDWIIKFASLDQVEPISDSDWDTEARQPRPVAMASLRTSGSNKHTIFDIRAALKDRKLVHEYAGRWYVTNSWKGM
jgi:hypothetical protein